MADDIGLLNVEIEREATARNAALTAGYTELASSIQNHITELTRVRNQLILPQPPAPAGKCNLYLNLYLALNYMIFCVYCSP
jgi:hypothetical protein